MQEERTIKLGNFTFLCSSTTKELVRAFTSSIDLDISKWVRSIIKSYLIDNKVINRQGELINGWGDPQKMKPKICPRNETEYDSSIGVRIDLNSPLYIGLLHYSTGNAKEAKNLSALLRYLVERELMLEEVITKAGKPTAKWSARLERINQAA